MPDVGVIGMNSHTISRILEDAGLRCTSIVSADLKAPEQHPSVLLVSVSGIDAGVEVIATIREKSHFTGRLIVLSRAESVAHNSHKLYDAGADIHLCTTIDQVLLVAIVRAQCRAWRPAKNVSYGNVHIDKSQRVVTIGDTPRHFPPKEFGLLQLLIESNGSVLSRNRAQAEVWSGADVDIRTIDVHIGRLRKRLTDCGGSGFTIRSVSGYGYRLVTE